MTQDIGGSGAAGKLAAAREAAERKRRKAGGGAPGGSPPAAAAEVELDSVASPAEPVEGPPASADPRVAASSPFAMARPTPTQNGHTAARPVPGARPPRPLGASTLPTMPAGGASPFARVAPGVIKGGGDDLQDAAHDQTPGRAAGSRQALRTPQSAEPDWPDKNTPPGSKFSATEWADARREAELQAGGPVYLVEIRNRAQSALLVLPRVPAPQVVKKMVGGKLVSEEQPLTDEQWAQGLDPLIGDLVDGCLLLSPSATTSHPRSVRELTFQSHDPAFGDRRHPGELVYRIARPAIHSEQPRLIPWETVGGTFTLPGAVLAKIAEDERVTRVLAQRTEVPDVYAEEHAERERPRG